MTYLRELNLSACGLYAIPPFVGKLKSLEVLEISANGLEIDAPLDFLIEGCPRLREVTLPKGPSTPPRTPGSWTHLKAFKTKLLAENQNVKMTFL